MNNQEMATVQTTSLSVNIDAKALTSLSNQRSQLRAFIKNELQKDSDYGIIPGVKKESLYKPGAEKLANIFQLGSRIIKSEKQIDLKENFAMISITVETFHLPTGKAISQCEGICNSQEKKYKTRKNYQLKDANGNKGVEEITPIGDILNTLTKMAQKRAYVGAVIIATGASDFFTMDVEDMPREYFQNEEQPKKAVTAFNGAIVKPLVVPASVEAQFAQASEAPQETFDQFVEASAPATYDKVQADPSYVVTFGKYKGQTIESVGIDAIGAYVGYLEKKAKGEGKPIQGQVLTFIQQYEARLK